MIWLEIRTGRLLNSWHHVRYWPKAAAPCSVGSISRFWKYAMLNRLHRHLFYVFLIIVTPIQVLGQDNGLSSFPARTELHSFISLTISDEQFLRGDDDGMVVTVSGELRIARGVARPPAVIMIHGSGGLGSKEQLWSDSGIRRLSSILERCSSSG